MKILLSLNIIIISMLFVIQAPAQQWQFAARYGGDVAGFGDRVNAMCTDAAGNVYVTGNFNSSINFGNGTATLTPTAGGTQTEGFVAKFSAAGLCQWAIDFGGAATDAGGLGIITDGTTVYVTGQSQFPSMIGTFGPLASAGGSTDGIVFALNAATGSTIWARAFGGASTTDRGQAICMDNAGHIYISGTFATRTANPTASFGTAGAFPRTVQGNITSATTDLFVAQLDAVTGNFNWVSTGGAASAEAPLVVGNDNVSGSGIAFLPGQNQLVIAGSFANGNAAYYSNGAATPAVTLTNAGEADICILRMDLSGNFLGGLSAGGANPDEALSVTWDATTSACYISGYFSSATLSGAFNLTNTAAGFDEVYYARYNPGTNTIAWAVSAAGSASGNDVAFGNDADATGLYITGRFQGAISFPGAVTPFTATATVFDEVFLVKIDPATGNAIQLATASGNSGTDAGMDVAVSTNNNIWVAGFFDGTLSFTPSSPAVSVTTGVDNELFLARYNDPPPSITAQPQTSTSCLGLSSSFTVASTGITLTYEWQESTDASFSTPATLTNTGIYSGATTATLTIANNTTVNGRYYRVRVTNSVGSVYSNAALLNATMPVLPTATYNQVQEANTSNNYYYGPSCALVAKLVPSGASPVTGLTASRVWIESTVPVHASQPFVQRHYQVTAAIPQIPTATATVTLYFSQAEFDAFNAAPGSVDDLPTGPLDNTGKANLRIGKYGGFTTNGTGLPDNYTSTRTVIDPPDENITWNAASGMWEITFEITGLGGLIVQTHPFPLPVKLLSFAAQLSGANVRVNWKTSEEQDHDHFELERSTDGRNFTTVASIEPVTGTGNKNYDYTDAGASLLNTSQIYYRLKMISTSGVAEYSNIIIVYLTPSSTPVTRAGPNPFHQKLELGLNMPESSMLNIQLTDIYGKIVAQEKVQAPKGFSTHIISKTQQLVPGMYVLTVNVGGQLYSFKVLKQN